MSYRLGLRSRMRLRGVDDRLVRVVEDAIRITEVDFTVLEGRRSRARQAQLVASGASKTMNSRHITGHAVDLGAWVGGKVSWHWPHYYVIARAVLQSARCLGVRLTWGGIWDRNAADVPLDDIDGAVADYAQRRRAAGKDAFLDGPHFQISWGADR